MLLSPGWLVAQEAFTDENFDQWVFQRQLSAATVRQTMLAQIKLKVDEIDRACGLSESQRNKIELAGQGDIKNFFRGYAKAKHEFQRLKNDREKINEIFRSIQPLQATLQAGLFEDGSLMDKVVQSALTAEQVVKYEFVLWERREFRHRAKVELAVRLIEQGAPLRDQQRRELIETLVHDAKPSPRPSQFDTYAILFQMSRIPRERLDNLLDEIQMKVLRQQLDQVRGMEPILRERGWLPE
jgi:hypothetical protein